MTLTPMREQEKSQAWTPEEIAEWDELVADLQRRAKERGLTTEKKILAEIKRVRERLYAA